ncbi:hypothetical protein MLD38_028909 [Melastoma candidum]|uniref:Uncharacterized protein n=1 Tax=Melastoma candidum TaxID=119954 RepID=A0ACB9N4M7_9MYRT|nr:hypothetical protein MLD38_028909 [Melastoma candidum]
MIIHPLLLGKLAFPPPAIIGRRRSQPPPTAAKKKRNLPGMPDPDAEVIALSPKTLLATNRFVCEICNKGFQRDQNLQLHRRGHNLPWKLRQRSSQEVKKKVYVCPETSCVHHDPSRALGDLTGIKKHFCRKHGEKKWKCDKCSKKYAVQSDWKAHFKICGTREYKCHCGTLFSRRDSFITHRAFCDALAEESTKAQAQVQGQGQVQLAPAPGDPGPESDVKPQKPASPPVSASPTAVINSPATVLPSLLADQAAGLQESPAPPQVMEEHSSGVVCIPNNRAGTAAVRSAAATGTLCDGPPPKGRSNGRDSNERFASSWSGIAPSPASSVQDQDSLQWTPGNADLTKSTITTGGLGLGLIPDGSSGLKELMMGTSSVLGPKHTTLDFLGLGMAASGNPNSGLSVLITSIGGANISMTAEATASFSTGVEF